MYGVSERGGRRPLSHSQRNVLPSSPREEPASRRAAIEQRAERPAGDDVGDVVLTCQDAQHSDSCRGRRGHVPAEQGEHRVQAAGRRVQLASMARSDGCGGDGFEPRSVLHDGRLRDGGRPPGRKGPARPGIGCALSSFVSFGEE